MSRISVYDSTLTSFRDFFFFVIRRDGDVDKPIDNDFYSIHEPYLRYGYFKRHSAGKLLERKELMHDIVIT